MAFKGKNRITKEEVEHISWLARIHLTEVEKEIFTEQFNKILEYFRIIDEAETRGIPPTYHIIDLKNVYRKDEPGNTLTNDEPLRNAPRKENRFFKSPRMV
ncbi:MAG: Asp-tRNA(Asn)/Glu-tRNA(Gln) amidotransferase subunit GatC [Candidatus Bathyarchaeota archaeon]|nr:Asp-tRNA(Asn)/Glu-tRNA(Gln) amidotransferase subunit GatC [Candidatus Bathyarchaeota archaeon]